MKNLALFYTLFFTAFAALAQTDEYKHCGADEMRINTLKKQPKVAQAVIQRDQILENHTADFVRAFYEGKNRSTVYTIPVIFHVIHQYGSENISDAQILDGLDILNKTFRKQLADTASIVAAFKPLHADCEIEFKLAKKDPNGNCTSGINRIASPLTSIGDHSVKQLIQWDPTKYLNVYIVENAAGLAGHCVWPSDADTIPEWDGIVIGHNYVGSIGTSNYTRSVAFAHECGHYLNLQHIWGGNNVPGYYYYPCADPFKDCGIDDLVADTPPTIGWQTCNLAGASCGNVVDNVQNTMDYSYCNRMFTYGQKARMQACLNSSIAGRDNLWTPANLIATGIDTVAAPLCYADFTANKMAVCPDAPANTITFTNTSYNGPFTGVKWMFEGGTPATSTAASPVVTYTVPGAYDVTLRVYNGTDSIETTKTNFISVLTNSGAPYPFTEGFETTTSLTGPEWFSASWDTINTWEITTDAAFSGTHSVRMSNYTNSYGTKDELISPMIDMSGATTMFITFKYAFAKKDSLCEDRLMVYVSNNCNTTWVPRLNLILPALETAALTTGNFIPANTSEWKQVAVGIPGSYLTADFRFKFQYTNSGGNNLYIDDINLDVDAGTAALEMLQGSLSVYPVPAENTLEINFETLREEKIWFEVKDVLGKTVLHTQERTSTEGKNQMQLDISAMTSGTYLLLVHTNSTTALPAKFIKH